MFSQCYSQLLYTSHLECNKQFLDIGCTLRSRKRRLHTGGLGATHLRFVCSLAQTVFFLKRIKNQRLSHKNPAFPKKVKASFNSSHVNGLLELSRAAPFKPRIQPYHIGHSPSLPLGRVTYLSYLLVVATKSILLLLKVSPLKQTSPIISILITGKDHSAKGKGLAGNVVLRIEAVELV